MIGSGTVFGPYRVIEKIGAGGMGEGNSRQIQFSLKLIY
jgi:hypothetical protein